MNKWRRLNDALAKMDARSNILSGGTQYTPDVSIAVAAINRNKARMRNEKTSPKPTRPLRELQRKV